MIATSQHMHLQWYVHHDVASEICCVTLDLVARCVSCGAAQMVAHRRCCGLGLAHGTQMHVLR